MFICVNSFEEADKYPVLFGTTECFLDNNVDLFYLKSVDQMGKYTMSTYEFKQIENPRPINPQDLVTQQRQLNDLTAKMDILLNALGQIQRPEETSTVQSQPEASQTQTHSNMLVQPVPSLQPNGRSIENG